MTHPSIPHIEIGPDRRWLQLANALQILDSNTKTKIDCHLQPGKRHNPTTTVTLITIIISDSNSNSVKGREAASMKMSHAKWWLSIGAEGGCAGKVQISGWVQARSGSGWRLQAHVSKHRRKTWGCDENPKVMAMWPWIPLLLGIVVVVCPLSIQVHGFFLLGKLYLWLLNNYWEIFGFACQDKLPCAHQWPWGTQTPCPKWIVSNIPSCASWSWQLLAN